jgi:hypothetical protein
MWRRTIRLAAAATCLLNVCGPVAGAPAAVAAAKPAGNPALESVATCVRNSNRLLVLMLIDESASLRQTDPGARRVTAVKSALAGFSSLAALGTAGGRPTVQVSLAGFSADFHTVVDWQGLDASTLPALQAQAEGFAGREDGIDTDFAAALSGAQSSLARRAAALTADGSVPPCRLVLQFTDGNYDIEPRNSPARRAAGLRKPYAPGLALDTPAAAAEAVRRGRAALCRPDGIADELRAGGGITVTVALTERISRADQSFLQAVGNGHAGTERCGRRGTAATGTLLAAPRLPELLAAFDDVVSGIGGGTRQPGKDRLPVCSRSACASGRRTFSVDRSLRRFHILADLGAPDLTMVLQAPGRKPPLVLRQGPPTSARLGSALAATTWLSPQAATIDVDLQAGRDDWAGTWSLTFVDEQGRHQGAVATSRIYLYGDLVPALVGHPVFRRGEREAIQAEVVGQDGTPRPPADLITSARLDATVRDPVDGGTSAIAFQGPDPTGTFKGTWQPAASLQASEVELTLRLSVTTVGGVVLAPAVRNYTVQVKPPASYPQIEPARLRLSAVTGVEAATGSLTVTGSELGAGCVWFDPPSFTTFPVTVGRIDPVLSPAPSSRQDCLRLGPGERRTIALRATPEAVGSGLASGVVVARLAGAGDEPVVTTSIPVSFTLARPVNQARRLELFLLILVGGIAMPLVLLYVANWAQARFRPTHLLRGAQVQVLIDADDRVVRLQPDGSPGRPLAPMERSEFVNVAAGSDDRVRRMTWLGLEFTARAPRLPFGAPFGVVQAGQGDATASDGQAKGPGLLTGRLPLQLAGTWTFVADHHHPDPSDPHDEAEPVELRGTLFALLNDPLTETAVERLENAVERDLPRQARELAAAARRRRPAQRTQEPTAAGVGQDDGHRTGQAGHEPDREPDWDPDREAELLRQQTREPDY